MKYLKMKMYCRNSTNPLIEQHITNFRFLNVSQPLTFHPDGYPLKTKKNLLKILNIDL